MSIRGAAVAWGLGMVCASGVAGRAQAAIVINQTVDIGQVGQGSVFLPASPATNNQSGYLVDAVFAGSKSQFFGGGVVRGAAMGPVSVNLGSDHVFRYTIEAPAGQQFRVNLPEGQQGAFSFNVHLGTTTGEVPGVTLTPPTSIGFEIDGVGQAVQAEGQGVDPAGNAILIGANEVGSHGSFTFRTLSVTLDYTVDSGNVPLTVADAARVLAGVDDAYVAFSTGIAAGVGDPAPQAVVTMEAVPEPASLGVVGMVVVGGLVRRRRRRHVRCG